MRPPRRWTPGERAVVLAVTVAAVIVVPMWAWLIATWLW